jgi:predicted transcriptional regulator
MCREKRTVKDHITVKHEETQTISVRLPVRIVVALDELAHKEHRSRSNLVSLAISNLTDQQ